MKRQIVGAFLLVGVISGCVSTNPEPETGGMRPIYGRSNGPPTVPGVEGPYGMKVPMAAPYNTAPPGSQYAAQQMMRNTIPMDYLQQHPAGMPSSGPPGMNMPNTMMPPGGLLSPPGVPGLPGGPGGNPFQKASMGGLPDRGVMNANVPPGAKGPGGVTPAQFASGAPIGSLFPAQRTQVFFPKPAGMKIYWFTQGADGKPNYSTTPLETPGRYNFAQGAIYRLKLTHIPGRPALELYPTLEVVPTSPKTNEFLAHNSVPVEFTEEDFKQVVDRNYIVKVIYLPDPQFQDAAGAGPDEIVSTRLEPGQDPIQEALRRGSILMVLRVGNIDQGLQHSPPTTSPGPGGPPMMMKPPGLGVMPFNQVPFPTPPITPGGMGRMPNQLPPFPGGNPPLLQMPPAPVGKPEVVPPPMGKPEIVPPVNQLELAPPNRNEINKRVVPPITFPTPPDSLKPSLPPIPLTPAPNSDKPFVPPIPNPLNQDAPGANVAPIVPIPQVVPASTSKEIETPAPLVLPTLPAADPGIPSRPELPMVPIFPAGKQ